MKSSIFIINMGFSSMKKACWHKLISNIMLSTTIYMRSTDEQCCILFSEMKLNPVNMHGRANSFFKQILSTHHCSRGWARGSSLSICFLISRYEPWKNAQACVVFLSLFLFFRKIKRTSVQIRSRDGVLCAIQCSQATAGKRAMGRRVGKHRQDKLISNNRHFDTERPPTHAALTSQSTFGVDMLISYIN